MKLKTKPQVKLNTDGTVEVWHSQSIKQSHNYQSADVTYGVKFTVGNNKSDIDAAVKNAESVVEDALATKVVEQRKLLAALGKDN